MKMKRLSDWYRHPRYYEAIFGTATVAEFDFLEAVNDLYGTGGNTFLEPACGAGRLIHEGARRGRRMVGYDLSPQMLAFARRRLTPVQRRRVHLEQASMESFAPRRWRGRVDLAFSLVSTFRYLPSDRAALAHLRHTRALLRPGGVYVLGFHFTDDARTRAEHERWVGQVGPETVVCNTREWPPDLAHRRSRMRNRLAISGPRARSLIETRWHFRTWNEEQVDALLQRAGLRLLGLYTFECLLEAPIPWDSDRLDRVLVLSAA